MCLLLLFDRNERRNRGRDEGAGEVTGIIPLSLFPEEVAHRGCTELITVDSMHERKRLMFERSDAFIALPGFGTLEHYTGTAAPKWI